MNAARCLLPMLLALQVGCGADTVGLVNHVDESAPQAAALARALAKTEGGAMAITDDELRAIVDKLKERALAGEVEAALVVVNLAALQRKKD